MASDSRPERKLDSVTPRAAMITARTSSNGNGHELNQIRLLFRLALALRFGKWI